MGGELKLENDPEFSKVDALESHLKKLSDLTPKFNQDEDGINGSSKWLLNELSKFSENLNIMGKTFLNKR